jgi:uncharacterized membrane protein YidH (DUF202 family)
VVPGLARERTNLAWTRTAISFAALGIAILKANPPAGVPILIFSAVIWQLGRLSSHPGESRTVARRALLTTVAITALAVVALAITLFGRGAAGLRL